MSSDEELKIIREIKRFVRDEKIEQSSTSELDLSSSDDTESVKCVSICISSDSDDDYFKLKDTDMNTGINGNLHRLLTSTPKETDWISASDPDLPKDTNKQDSCVVNSPSSIVKISSVDPLKTFFKRKRRTNLRGEKRRVDASVRRAKEKFQNRAVSAQVEWRQSKTFGLGLDVKNQSASKENSLLTDQEKLEVQEVLCRAVGDPYLPSKLSRKDEVSDTFGGSHSSSIASGRKINSTQSLRHLKKSVNLVNNDTRFEKFSVDVLSKVAVENSEDASALSKNQRENQRTCILSTDLSTTVALSSNISEKKLDRETLVSQTSPRSHRTIPLSDEGSYSPPSDSYFEASTSLSIPRSSPMSASSDSSVSRDTSRIPKSPWFRGKTLSETSENKVTTLTALKELRVPCVRVEHYIQFSELDTPYILLNGSRFAILPEQWLEILEVASVEASLIV